MAYLVSYLTVKAFYWLVNDIYCGYENTDYTRRLKAQLDGTRKSADLQPCQVKMKTFLLSLTVRFKIFFL